MQSVANISLQTQKDVTSSPAAKGTINGTLSLKRYIGPYTYDAPQGFQRVPNGWKLEKMSDNNKRTNNKTFDELLLDKIKGSVNKTKQTRQRIDLRALVSQKSLLGCLIRKKEEEDEKTTRKEERERKKKEKEKEEKTGKEKVNITQKKKKKVEFSSDSEIHMLLWSDDVSEGNKKGKMSKNGKQLKKKRKEDDCEDDEINDDILINEIYDANDAEEKYEESVSESEGEKEVVGSIEMSGNLECYGFGSMEECWKTINPPELEADLIGKWFACIFRNKKTSSLYLGRVTKRSLSDDTNGYACDVELDCLPKKYSTVNCTFEDYKSEEEEDIIIFPISDIISGPLRVKMQPKGNKWEFPQYLQVIKIIDKVKKLGRAALHNIFICNLLKNND